MYAMKSVYALLAVFVVSATLPAAELPDRDQRNVVIRHTDTKFEMPEYRNLRRWKERAAALREEILFSAGLLPLPEKTPLNAQVFGKIGHEDYSIEKVILETYPGFFLGGNLYRPAGKSGRLPGVVSPHGHWRYGRLENQPLNSIPGRGISLARQGYVAFTYDMIGYNDTAPRIPHNVPWGKKAHMWGRRHPGHSVVEQHSRRGLSRLAARRRPGADWSHGGLRGRNPGFLAGRC